MQPIDRPFRLSMDFCLVWVVLAVVTWFLLRRTDIGPWYSHLSAIILLPFFATFVLYGPVLLARQIVRSGSRGRLVLRVFLSILVVAMIFAAVLLITGQEASAAMTGAATFTATLYLNWRLREGGDARQ